MTMLTASAFAKWPIIKQLAQLFGLLMQGIFICLSKVNILSIAACITVFTIITKMLLLPLTIKQQKNAKVSAAMNPELQALQKKYEGKKDQNSMAKMQVEQQAIYDKYGSSMAAGCLPSLIQFPVLFALYPVIYSLTEYVPQIANYSAEEIDKMYMFMGINLQNNPRLFTLSMIIPILAGGLQFLSTKLMTPASANKDDPTARSMNSMMYTMPLFTVYICFSFKGFLGFYWVIQSLVMIIQQYVINRHMNKISIDDIIKENIEKRDKKRARQGLPPIGEMANTNTRKINTMPVDAPAKRDNTEQVRTSTEYYNQRVSDPNSLAAKANMVREFNERNDRSKK